jgi:hypothetical protein
MEAAMQNTRLKIVDIIAAGSCLATCAPGRALVAVTVSLACHAIVNQSASAAAIEQSAPNKPWSADAYRVQWEDPQVPDEVAVNLKVAVPVIVRNIGNRVWPASQVFVAYHWYRDHRLVVWDGERTALPRDLGAGGRAALSVRVVTPAEPGSYVLQLALVHELVTWFETKGAATVTRPVTVRVATPSGDRTISASTIWPAAQ